MQESCVLFLCYVLAISLQLAGALLLIIRYSVTPMKTQLRDAHEKASHVDEAEETISIGIPVDSEVIEEIRLNRLAFIYIAVGYLFGIWGESFDVSKWLITGLVILLTVIEVAIGKAHSKRASKKPSHTDLS